MSKRVFSLAITAVQHRPGSDSKQGPLAVGYIEFPIGALRRGPPQIADIRNRARTESTANHNRGKRSLPAGAAVERVRARIAPGSDLGQPAEVMGPAFRMAGALLGSGQAGVSQAQQGPVRLLDQVDLDQARPRRHHLAAVPAK